MKKIDFIIKIAKIQKNLIVIKEMFASKGYETLSIYFPTSVPEKDQTINRIIEIEVEKIVDKLKCDDKSLLFEELIGTLQGSGNLYQILDITKDLNVEFED